MSSTLKDYTKEEREDVQIDINRSFDDNINRPDYARKLYLIERCIYGVDIQSIAVQISKLRFFISLVVDQCPTHSPEDNFGIRPLPNLEAKFVAANTLIGLSKTKTLFDSPEVEKLQEKLNQTNHRIFGAKSNKAKNKYKARVEELQIQIAEKLEELGVVGNDDARLMQQWKMFDQNASSPFFDPEWMFGLKSGASNQDGYFDIVIGNPPYGAKLTNDEKIRYRVIYPESKFKIDTYSLFILHSMNVLKVNGICTFIIPNTLLDNYFEESVRKKLLLENRVYQICDLNDKVFESAVVHAMIFSFINEQKTEYQIKVNITKSLTDKNTQIPKSFFLKQDKYIYSIRSHRSDSLIKKLKIDSKPLEEVLDIRQAIKSGDDKKYISKTKNNENFKPILRGKDVFRYSFCSPNLYINYGKHLACPRDENIFKQPKLLIREAGNKITATYDESGYYIMSSLYNAILKNADFDLRYLLALINSKLFQYLMNISTFEKTKGAFTKAKIYHYYSLPVKITANQQPLTDLVDKILRKKQSNPDFDTLAIETDLDKLIYQLYDLSVDEIRIIES